MLTSIDWYLYVRQSFIFIFVQAIPFIGQPGRSIGWCLCKKKVKKLLGMNYFAGIGKIKEEEKKKRTDDALIANVIWVFCILQTNHFTKLRFCRAYSKRACNTVFFFSTLVFFSLQFWEMGTFCVVFILLVLVFGNAFFFFHSCNLKRTYVSRENVSSTLWNGYFSNVEMKGAYIGRTIPNFLHSNLFANIGFQCDWFLVSNVFATIEWVKCRRNRRCMCVFACTSFWMMPFRLIRYGFRRYSPIVN